MSKYRSQSNGKSSRKYFTKTATKVNPRNMRRGPKRGGYRL